MKILFAIKTIDGSKGGAEKVLADISSGMSIRGHHVSVLSFDNTKGRSFYDFGAKVKRIRLAVGNVLRKATFWEVIMRMRVIRKVVTRHKPDVVVAFMHSSFIPCSFALIGTGVPVIASEHIVPTHYKKRKWEFLLLICSRFFVKKITVLSNNIIETYPVFLQGKMIPIANPVKEARIPNTSEDEANKEKIILNVGRLTDQKAQHILIEAFAMIADKYPDWVVRIIGEGERLDSLTALAAKLNITDRIIFAGTTSNIDAEYSKANIFALPSSYESFGLATAEAMSHGVPPIGFAECPGTNEIIEHGKSGFLVEGINSPEKYAQGLETLMQSKKERQRLGIQAKSAIKQFHPEKILDDWETLIKQVIRENGKQVSINTKK